MRPIREFSGRLSVALTLAVFACDVCAEAQARGDSKAVAEGNTAFALDLYGKLAQNKGNLCVAPHSISTALAMTYAGARGDTEKQMAKVLHFSLDQNRLHPGFAALEAPLRALQATGDVELRVANALWPQKGHPFRSEFLDVTKRYYGAAIECVDFVKAREAARKKINTWAKQETKDRIPELIPPGLFTDWTRLVLTNAIYFKGNWQSQFEAKRTTMAPFRIAAGKSAKVPMMVQDRKFRYMEEDNVQVLELPYVGNALSMIVLLPKRVGGLGDLEASLSTQNLSKWLGRLRETTVQTQLPKFKLSSKLKLADTLVSMGMSDAFDMKKADFSGMDGRRWLYISAVVHETFVTVNEEGSEAAGATAVVMKLRSRPPARAVFHANHPFVFVIRHNPSGSLLFVGRVVDPRG